MKTDEEKKNPIDVGASWTVMADKGFQGAQYRFRTVLPHKKPRLRSLNRVQENENERIAGVRILAENFYARMVMTFKITDVKYLYDKNMYGMMIRLCIALTNFDLMKRPLRRLNYKILKQNLC